MVFDFIQYCYENLPSESGVYIIEVKGGKKYIGQSTNIKERIQRHMRAIFGENATKQEKAFYRQVKEIVQMYNFSKQEIDRLFSFQVMKTEKPEFYERELLFSVSDRKGDYYNTWWGSQQKLNLKIIENKRKGFSMEKESREQINGIEFLIELYIKEETIKFLENKSWQEISEFLEENFKKRGIENINGIIFFYNRQNQQYLDTVKTIKLRQYLVDFYQRGVKSQCRRSKIKNFLDSNELSELLIKVYKSKMGNSN